ncbi:Cai-1 autoinducer sensor kinase/phosphatase cqss [Plakobranchus ocellatus]|uniref:Cai-1 autoinducer sensor kinase/phosphatase cqss n=1 Tax=Plakobranchus ocellatus TaxID=259542 RepID=A0AAV4A5Q4_9GAST|nr:Cai-1 autoinducer sensor kinase/phosphatase cqss [Plakobranchus ocellatus]
MPRKLIQKYHIPTFKRILRSMNISMTLLGHERCKTCSKSELHKRNCTYEEVSDISEILNKKKYRKARQEYKQDSAMDDKLVMSTDLQKAVMLPRMNELKEAFFYPQTNKFNETFAAGRISPL